MSEWLQNPGPRLCPAWIRPTPSGRSARAVDRLDLHKERSMQVSLEGSLTQELHIVQAMVSKRIEAPLKQCLQGQL